MGETSEHEKRVSIPIPTPAPQGAGTQRQILHGLEPRALRHEPCALSHEPLTANNRLINEKIDNIHCFKVSKSPKKQKWKFQKIQSFKVSSFKNATFRVPTDQNSQIPKNRYTFSKNMFPDSNNFKNKVVQHKFIFLYSRALLHKMREPKVHQIIKIQKC